MSNVLLMSFGKNGAAPSFTLEMAKGFFETGDKVFCIVTSKVANYDEWEQAKSEGINVYFLETGNKKTIIPYTVKFLLGQRKRILEFINEPIDISIQTFVHPWMNVINKWIKPTHKMAIMHDPLAHSGESRLNVILSKIQYAYIPEIIVLTRSFIPEVINRYHKKESNVYFIRHGLFSSYKNELSIANNLSDSEDINFIFFGRIEKYKGIEVLLNAYLQLEKKFDNVKLSVWGSGNIREYTNIIDNIRNIDLQNRFIEDKEIAMLFSRPNSVLVLPYLDATQSGVAPIAIDFMLPIIATDSGGLREQLNDGKIGLFVEANNVEALLNAMEKVVVDRELFVEQRRRSEEFRDQLVWRNIVEGLKTVIDEKTRI